MGLCENRYTVVNIKQVTLRTILDHIIIGDGYYLLSVTRKMISVLVGENVLKILRQYYPDPSGESDYLKFFIPDRYTNPLFSNAKTLTIIIDHWDMEIPPLNSDFKVHWAKENLNSDELENIMYNIQAINFGLINNIDLLDKMIKFPQMNWVRNYCLEMFNNENS